MSDIQSNKPKYEAPAALAIGDLPVGSGQTRGICTNGSSAASGCGNGGFASDRMGWVGPSCQSGTLAAGKSPPDNDCETGGAPTTS